MSEPFIPFYIPYGMSHEEYEFERQEAIKEAEQYYLEQEYYMNHISLYNRYTFEIEDVPIISNEIYLEKRITLEKGIANIQGADMDIKVLIDKLQKLSDTSSDLDTGIYASVIEDSLEIVKVTYETIQETTARIYAEDLDNKHEQQKKRE